MAEKCNITKIDCIQGVQTILPWKYVGVFMGNLQFVTACIAIWFGAFSSTAQESANIVPNSSFELYASTPLGWFYTGEDFSRVVKYWESPTAASPDIYGPKVYIPSEWKDQGFGNAKPHTGRSMVGLTCYGCEHGKPHCREYVQVQLNEPLVEGQRYHLEFWAKPMEHSLRIHDLGAAFSVDRVRSTVDALLDLSPVLVNASATEYTKDNWVRVEGEFVASSPCNYIVIGNFSPDSETHLSSPEDAASLSFAYYYIDDVDVHKLPPIIDVPIAENDLRNASLEKGAVIRLNNIYFDHDKDEFLPRSFRELNQLLEIMREHTGMRILIQGHTDNVGDEAYNFALSLARAEAVSGYLTGHGVAQSRITCVGFGSTKPVDTNDSEAGRSQNRRVEFVIVAK